MCRVRARDDFASWVLLSCHPEKWEEAFYKLWCCTSTTWPLSHTSASANEWCHCSPYETMKYVSIQSDTVDQQQPVKVRLIVALRCFALWINYEYGRLTGLQLLVATDSLRLLECAWTQSTREMFVFPLDVMLGSSHWSVQETGYEFWHP